jgi:hypothetical protein
MAILVQPSSSTEIRACWAYTLRIPGSGLPLFHYVQDAFTLEKEVLSGWDITFSIGA